MPTRGRPSFSGDPHDPLVGLLLSGEAVLLDLEVDVVRTERLDQVVGVGAGFGRSTFEQVLAEPRLKAPGEGDHAFGVRARSAHVDRRLAALVALEEARRGELDEVPVAGRGRRQQRQMEPLQTPRGAPRVVIDDVCLAPEDRLDPVLAAGGEQLHGAVHDAVVGQPERRLIEGRRARRKVVDLARPIQ